METADVRKRVQETIERAKRAARDRRARAELEARDFEAFLSRLAVPLLRQVAGALKAAGHPFAVQTPEGAVRLVSERSADDYIELTLDTGTEDIWVTGHTRRTWGRRVVETERPVRRCPVKEITEDDVLAFVLQALEPFVER
ncbi:MAG: hypothetical protein AB7O32_17275 [Vicinamibacterales bacterium]